MKKITFEVGGRFEGAKTSVDLINKANERGLSWNITTDHRKITNDRNLFHKNRFSRVIRSRNYLHFPFSIFSFLFRKN